MRRRIPNPAPRAAGLAAIVLAFVLLVTFSAPSRAAGDWVRVPYDSAVFGSSGHALMFDVGSSSPGLVAVGMDSGVNGAAIWLSPDGTTWTRVPDQPDFDRGLMTGVIEGPATMVAVGYVELLGGDDAAVWTGDGLTWSRVPNDPAVLGGAGDQVMHDVCAGGPGVVAVGHEVPAGEANPNAAVWTSPDGVTWARVPHDEAVLGGQGEVYMVGVAAGGPGLVAVGWDDSGGDRDAAVWVSADGLTWSRVHHVEGLFGGPGNQVMNSVTVGDGGLLVAVGHDDGAAVDGAVVWTSADGVHWTRLPHVEGVFGGPGFQSMEDVAQGGPGYVAVGKVFSGTLTVAAAWTSVDGTVWERAPHDPVVFGRSDEQLMSGVAVDDYGLVVGVGRATDANKLIAAVWVNDTWWQSSGPVAKPSVPVPTDGPNMFYNPRLFENRLVLVGIAVAALILGGLGWRLVRGRQSGR